MKCKKEECTNEVFRNHPFCTECERKFLFSGICKWCGIEPRVPKDGPKWRKQCDYCVACKKLMNEYLLDSWENQPDKSPIDPGHRGKDSRENLKETKGGY